MNFDGYEKLKLGEDYEVIYNSDNIICFKSFNKKDDFIEEWQDIQASVAGNIQANLGELGLNESLAWNIYIIFIINFGFDKNLKNKIESNTFCCKKYIVEVDNIDNDSEIENKIKESIALFAEFDFGNGQVSSSSDDIIKKKIVKNIKESSLSRKFLETENIKKIIEDDEIEEFIRSLKSEYMI